jgi:hypothetical protein
LNSIDAPSFGTLAENILLEAIMLLRDHPLMSYKGVPSWTPDWIWTDGLEDKRPKGEIGVFRRVVQSNIQPSNRCFLFIDYEESSYIGCLTVDDSVFCDQITKLLQDCCNRPIAEIGGLELPGRAKGRVDSSSWLSGSPRRDLRTG